MEKRADIDGNGTIDVSHKFVYNGMNLSLTANANGSTAEVFMSGLAGWRGGPDIALDVWVTKEQDAGNET